MCSTACLICALNHSYLCFCCAGLVSMGYIYHTGCSSGAKFGADTVPTDRQIHLLQILETEFY